MQKLRGLIFQVVKSENVFKHFALWREKFIAHGFFSRGIYVEYNLWK